MYLYDLVATSRYSLLATQATARNPSGTKVINFSQYGHRQKYTPGAESTYIFFVDEGLVPTLDQTVPSITSLDIEDNRASIPNGGRGGPKDDIKTNYPAADVTGFLGQAPKRFTYQDIPYTYPK